VCFFEIGGQLTKFLFQFRTGSGQIDVHGGQFVDSALGIFVQLFDLTFVSQRLENENDNRQLNRCHYLNWKRKWDTVITTYRLVVDAHFL
jgi:hypothetical protein